MNMSQQYLDYLVKLYDLRNHTLAELKKYEQFVRDNQNSVNIDKYRDIVDKLKEKLFDMDRDILIRLDIIKE